MHPLRMRSVTPPARVPDPAIKFIPVAGQLTLGVMDSVVLHVWRSRQEISDRRKSCLLSPGEIAAAASADRDAVRLTSLGHDTLPELVYPLLNARLVDRAVAEHKAAARGRFQTAPRHRHR